MTTTDDRIVTAAVRLFVEKGTTQVTISELAQEANVARGTLYRNVGSMDDLFDRVVGEVTADLHRRVSASFATIDDSATRLATGIRMWVRYAHENPQLGRFAVKFGLGEETLRSWMTGPRTAKRITAARWSPNCSVRPASSSTASSWSRPMRSRFATP